VPASGDDDPAGQHRDGVVLPSQAWISAGLAALIASVAVLVRLRRRRQARHTFPIPVGLDPDPDPVPPGLRLADEAGRPQLAARPDPPAPLPNPPAAPAAIGTDSDREEVSLFDLPGGGVALDGDGALGAVRAVLAAVVSTGVLETVAHRPVVVTTTDTLRRLLPVGAPLEGLDPDRVSFEAERLVVLADTAAAVTELEEEVIHRRRLLDSLDVDSIDEANAMPDHAEYQPVRVLLIQTSPRHEARLSAIAAHADTLRLRLVVLGPTASVPTLTVDATGTITADPQDAVTEIQRLSTLAASDLAGVLDLVRAAAPRPVAGFDIDEDTAPEDPPATTGVATTDIPTEPENPVPVWLTVLGPTTLTVNGTLLATGIRSGSRAVLTLLAVHPKGRTLDEIVADLHPTVAPAQAISRVKTDITSLRTVLRATAGPGFERAWFVQYDSATARYRIEPDTIDVDVWKMIRAIEAANTVAEDDDACQAALREAVSCYGGDFAADDPAGWSIGYATTLRHQYLSALTRIAEILEPDHPDQAAAVLEQAISVDMTNEELYQRLMRIHGRNHRPDEVRRLLQLLSDRLMQAGEAEPSEATRRVAMRQLHQDSPR
jgi:DNA-binding SARP family transcriptional activator